ncbi:serine hydrolase [Nocardioides litoris]|uniref:serine hydrolase n=1 Tax=Nocardioides litoris TaxID=1926648 RepID=UPI001476C5C0|nr:serine hydrolase [Nocardioides litoris]
MPEVSLHVVDAGTGEVLATADADREQPTASVGKVLLLGSVAVALESGALAPSDLLDRRAVAPVADSGLWHLMAVDALPVADVALLVAAVSDNLATNVLLDRLGLPDPVGDLALHDVVRDARGPVDPPTLSTGTARGWAELLSAVHRREWPSAAAADRLLGWLAAGVDHSLVLAPLGRDPLVVDAAARGKTGADEDVRCDVGLVTGPTRTAAYAVLGRGDPAELVPRLREVGAEVAALV